MRNVLWRNAHAGVGDWYFSWLVVFEANIDGDFALGGVFNGVLD